MQDLILLFGMIITPLYWLRIIKKFSWKKISSELIPFNSNFGTELIGGAKLFLALLIGFVLLSTLFTSFGLNDLEKVGEVVKINSQNLLLFLTLMIILVFVEEYFFRGFLVNRIGLIPSSILFGLAHIGYGSIAELIGAIFLGLILAYWFKQNKSIIQNYLGHLLYNLLAIGLYLFLN